MRWHLLFKGPGGLDIPPNIRSFFISFLKKVFSEASENLYESLFSAKKVKPYVFSPFFGEEFIAKKKIGKNVSLIFSTGDYFISSLFWNGLANLERKEGNVVLNLGNTQYLIDDLKQGIHFERGTRIFACRVLFRTVGVIVLTDPSKTPHDFNEWYTVPMEENISRVNQVLETRVSQRYTLITGKQRKVRIKLYLPSINELRESKVLCNEVISEVVLPHYGGFVKGFRGYFILESSPDVLQFLYDYGLGVRTGQGFGLINVVRQYAQWT